MNIHRKILSNGLSRVIILATILIIVTGLLFPRLQAQDTTEDAHPLAEGVLVTHALRAIARDYLEPERINPFEMLKGALEQMERLVPEILVTYHDSRSATVTVGVAAKKFNIGTVSSLEDLQQNLIAILAFIDQHYHGDIEKDTIEYAAIEGMLSELDPHSAFLTPKVYKEFRIGTKGEFGGLGIVISIKDGELTVISPLEGTPAWRAGIKAGDKIMQIGDESTINMSLTDAVNRLRGKVGTSVRIVVTRPGKPSSFPVTLTRAIINIDSVQSMMLMENGKRIGYIKLKSFQANSDDDFAAALTQLNEGGAMNGLILDMRNNPGGLLNQAIDIADHFLSSGTIVKTVVSRGVLMDTELAHSTNLEPDYPIIVLVNEGSASASEIVAGALMANDRALIMGHRSFGKGSVQTIFEIGGGSAIKLTIAKYLPAGTMSIQSLGITPDVQLVPKTVDREHIDLVDDKVQSEMDLEKHLEKTGEELGEPAYRASFYEDYEKEDDDVSERIKEYSRTPDVESDFAVQLAKTLLGSVTSPSRAKMLTQIKEPIAASDAAQKAIIAQHLAALGIDWSTTPKKEPSLLQLTYNLRRGSDLLKSALAGTDVQLELVAKNVGKGTYSQLVAVGQSENPLLKNREFVFGKLGPGETKRWRVPLKIPTAMPSQDLTMDISFHDQHEDAPEPITTIIPLQGVQPPRFAYTYRLVEKGNLKSGKTLHLTVTAFNIGTGASSSETVMTLGNKSGKDLFIKQGRSALGAMATGTSKSATFMFRLAKEYPDPTMKLELNILDPKTLTILSKEFTVDVKTATLTPPAGKRYQPPDIVLSNAVHTTSSKDFNLTGLISDTDAVRDFFIFVDDKKVAYMPNAQATTEMPLNATLPLEEGNNTVAIAARDGYELTGRKILVIKRNSEKDDVKKAEHDG